ncbi:T9SS type A sorting domain-containing protein [Chryseobacterium populi]|uniref:Por secretion system C-terminal sorting domain containing protein n=1 Tax=Chryseobacterium populi TaxID=1144316 RepID=J2KG59_9FLAO|nr:T9SS type A sorting domain-containing protein [Chryseobacterium populi]EJL72108.1 Por secretion system C-terminal sorting domain containing protein [Chryseobacterium populi]
MKNIYYFLFIALSCSFIKAQAPDIEWQKSLGGTFSEQYPDIQQTSDGGYIVAGSSSSHNGDVTGNHGSLDQWVVKLNSSGMIQWQKCLGGSSVERAYSVRQTADGGYIVAGSTESNNGDVTGNHGSSDYWVVKLDASGNLTWQKTLGGTGIDIAKSIRQTSDGGYIVSGRSSSVDGDITGNLGNSDYWVVKLSPTGNLQWQKSLGGEGPDEAASIEQTTDGGYIVAGTSWTSNTIIIGHGFGDYWVVKLDPTGNTQWQKSFGGSNTDNACSVKQTSDGGYIVLGTSSSIDGDITASNGNDDYWVVKMDALGNLQWQKSYGDDLYDRAFNINTTSDGGYAVVGYSGTPAEGNPGSNDYWMLKLKPNGDVDWHKKFGGLTDDTAMAVQQTSDGGYIISGYSDAITGTPGNYNYWIIKLGGKRLSTEENLISEKPHLYPNPAKESFYLDNLPGEVTVHITDMSGRKLFNQKYNEKKVSISTNQFINGVYVIQVQHQGKTILSDKLIIKK